MDKYLMSSPTQVSQAFEMNNENRLMTNMNLFETLMEAGNDEDTEVGLSTLHEKNPNHPVEDDSEDLVPLSNNDKSNLNLQFPHDNIHMSGFQDINLSNFGNMTDKFQNSINVALDDGLYNSQFILDSRKSTQNFSHKSSLSTSSMISLNQDPPFTTVGQNRLQSSYSNNTIYSIDSLLPLSSSVSNQSLLDSPSSIQQSQLHLSQQPTATPRVLNRKKSLSVSSNVLTTPLRGGNSTNLSPVNLMTNKVSKTPYLGKAKGHRRSRSRLSLDFSNTHLLLNSVTKSASSQNLMNNNLNPFYTSLGSISPSLDHVTSDVEDIYASLPTPTVSRSRNFAHLNPLTTEFSNESTWTGAATAEPGNGLRSIEDQDDDAFTQLRKARSYSSFNSGLNKSTGHVNIDSQGVDILHNKKYQNITAQSTPGLLASPKLAFGLDDVNQMTCYSPSNSENTNKSYTNNDLHSKLDMHLNYSDTTLQDFNSSHNSSLNIPRPSVKFTKSFPASTDLASMTVPSGDTFQFHNTPTLDIAPLLPPIVTFPAIPHDSHEQNVDGNSKTKSELKLIGKALDKAEPIDPKKKHPCPLCHARFQRPEHVKRHMKSHSSEKPFECDEPNCGKRFNRKDNLKAHLKKIHQRKA